MQYNPQPTHLLLYTVQCPGTPPAASSWSRPPWWSHSGSSSTISWQTLVFPQILIIQIIFGTGKRTQPCSETLKLQRRCLPIARLYVARPWLHTGQVIILYIRNTFCALWAAEFASKTLNLSLPNLKKHLEKMWDFREKILNCSRVAIITYF